MATVIDNKSTINPQVRTHAAPMGPISVGRETLEWDRRFGMILGGTIGAAIIIALGALRFAM